MTCDFRLHPVRETLSQLLPCVGLIPLWRGSLRPRGSEDVVSAAHASSLEPLGKPPAAPRRRWAVISRLLRPWLSLKRRRREQHSDHNARCCQLGPPQDHTARSGCVCLRGNPENSARVHHVRITTARKPAPSAPRGQSSSCGEKSFRLGLGFSAVGFPRR